VLNDIISDEARVGAQDAFAYSGIFGRTVIQSHTNQKMASHRMQAMAARENIRRVGRFGIQPMVAARKNGAITRSPSKRNPQPLWRRANAGIVT